jgi:2-keto-4-pentenoate hydratase/2-oxohepta-3-ene-1,7-dioic acid hydratase in catechol pathway
MRLCTFELKTPLGPASRVGVETPGGRIIDANLAYAVMLVERDDHPQAYEVAAAVVPPEMLHLLRAGDFGREALTTALDYLAGRADQEIAGPRGEVVSHEPGSVRLLAPLARPNSIRDTISFEQHYANVFGPDNIPDIWYEIPLYYKGNADTVQGPDTDVEWPDYSDQLDFELEFAAVLGRRGRDIPVSSAMDHVYGFTIFNDISARDVQFREMRGNLGPTKGKDMDGGNVLGPFIVTTDEWDPADDHAMEVRVDGERWGGGLTSAMYHSFAEIISYMSRGETLYPGDVVGSGTVGTGCGLELGRYPQPGSYVELEIDGLGILANRFVRSAH